MLMAVNTNGQPQLTSATIDGKQVNTYLAAMSIAAAEEIITGQRFSVPRQQASALRFTPVSLAKFNALITSLLKQKSQNIGVIAPDPAQASTAEKLLISQKVPPDQARQIAAKQPMIFCPEPGLLVSFNEGPEKGREFVPCSTEASFVESIVQRGIKDSTQLAKLKPRVIAIPLDTFVNHLREQPTERVGQLRVIPNSRLVELIQQINKQASTEKPNPPTK